MRDVTQEEMYLSDINAASIVKSQGSSEDERRATWATRFRISGALQAEFLSVAGYSAYMEKLLAGQVAHVGLASPFRR